MGRVRYIPNQRALDAHYQSGGSPYFQGQSHQRGHGLGGLFGKLFRAAVPVFRNTILPAAKAGVKSVATEAARAGLHVAGDMLDGNDLGESLERHATDSARRLVKRGVRRMDGMMGKPRKRRKTIKGRRDIYK